MYQKSSHLTLDMYFCILQILKPMMLRRLKEDVEKNLAAKEETIVEVKNSSLPCFWKMGFKPETDKN